MTDDPKDTASKGTIRLSEEDLEEIAEFPDFPDREEFVKTLEMDSQHELLQQAARDSSAATDDETAQETRPVSPLDDTQHWDVPPELLDAASRSGELEIFDDWGEFRAHVDHRGRITLPSRTHKVLRGKTIRVRFKLEQSDD